MTNARSVSRPWHRREAFVAMDRRVMTRARHLSFDVKDSLGGGDSLFLAWTMNVNA